MELRELSNAGRSDADGPDAEGGGSGVPGGEGVDSTAGDDRESDEAPDGLTCPDCGGVNDCRCDDVETLAEGRERQEYDAQADDEHERAAARARGNDFEETDGKDWT